MRLAAIIIENRPSQGLKWAIDSVKKYVPECDLFAFGTGATHKYFNGFTFEQLPNHPQTLRDYNKLMTSHGWWERWNDYDRVLIFQSDSEILRPGIEDFLKWDYIGAPWLFQQHGGNGGLSLRNPKTMKEIINKSPWQNAAVSGYEDVYFCNEMYNKKIGKLAPREICTKFSCEAIFQLGTLGYHGINNYLTNEQVKKIKRQYILFNRK